MTHTSIERNVRFARDVNEDSLRQIERVLHGIDPTGMEISATFKNDLTVKCKTVDELLAVPATLAHSIKNLLITCDESYASANSAGRVPTRVRVRMSDQFAFTKSTYEITSNYNECVGLDQQLLTVFKPTLRFLRSALHLHPIIDFALALIILPVLTFRYLLPIADITIPPEGFFLVQIPVGLLYLVAKTVLYPRIQFRFGRGGRLADIRGSSTKWLFGFVVVGAIGVIFEDHVLQVWKGILGDKQ